MKFPVKIIHKGQYKNIHRGGGGKLSVTYKEEVINVFKVVASTEVKELSLYGSSFLLYIMSQD